MKITFHTIAELNRAINGQWSKSRQAKLEARVKSFLAFAKPYLPKIIRGLRKLLGGQPPKSVPVIFFKGHMPSCFVHRIILLKPRKDNFLTLALLIHELIHAWFGLSPNFKGKVPKKINEILTCLYTEKLITELFSPKHAQRYRDWTIRRLTSADYKKVWAEVDRIKKEIGKQNLLKWLNWN